MRAGTIALLLAMRIALTVCIASSIAAGILADSAFADKPAAEKESKERTVFVTGSLIPQRIKLKRIGTTTVSPIRVIDRQEIDATGRQTTRGEFGADPAIRIIGR